MQYNGGKSRLNQWLAEHIAPYVSGATCYVEPFVGGGSVVFSKRFDALLGDTPRIVADANPYITALWEAVATGWEPPEFVSREEYASVRDNQRRYHPAYVAFVGYGCSFGGKWFGGYASNRSGTNYAAQSRRVLLKHAAYTANTRVVCCTYDALDVPRGALVYCDPPYAGTTGYVHSVDHAAFWEWCRRQVLDKDARVVVSEYTAPADFLCIAECERRVTLDKAKNTAGQQAAVERLFTYEG